MEVSKQDHYRLLYEYCFYSAIKDYNDTADIHNRAPIMTEEARHLREKMDKYMAKNGYRLESGRFTDYYKAFKVAVGPRTGGVIYGKTRESFKAKMDTDLREFWAMTGLSDKNGTLSGDHYLPISPYDPRFANRDVVLSNGSNLGGITDREGLNNFKEVLDYENAESVHFYKNLRANQKGVWQAQETEETLWGPNDITGLARLRKYMTQAEYDQLNESQWLSKGHDLRDLSQKTQEKRDRAINRSVQLLEDLSNLGREYSISPDMNFGQIKAKIANTKVTVRVTDGLDNADYIGRVYDDGAVVNFTTTYKEKVGNSWQSRMYTPKDHEVIDLVKFALGEPVKNWDRPDMTVGADGQVMRQISKQKTPMNASYHTKKRFVSVIGDYKRPVEPDEKLPRHEIDDDDYTKAYNFDNKVLIYMDNSNRSRQTSYFKNAGEAETYLKRAVASAHENLVKAVDLDGLLKAYYDGNLPEDMDDWTFSKDPEVEMLQRSYFEVLSGQEETLLKPGAETDQFLVDMGDPSVYNLATPEGRQLVRTRREELSYPAYSMDPVEIIQKHFEGYQAYKIGQYDRDPGTGLRFDPVTVAAYQDTEYNLYRNHADIVKALRMLNIGADELRGDAFYNETISRKLVKFDPDHAIYLKGSQDPFLQAIHQTVCDSLTQNGLVFDENDILYDQNGIIKYKGKIKTNDGTSFIKGTKERDIDKTTNYEEVEGLLGQIFAPDDLGVVYTRFNSSGNYAFVPGYEAHIIPQKPGESLSLEERTRLKGYEQVMAEAIRYQVRQDLLVYDNDDIVGSPTGLNQTYGQLYDERHDFDFINRFKEQGMDQSVLHDIIRTEASRVRYSNSIRDNSTIHADYMDSQYNLDAFNDNSRDPYILTGKRNMAILTEASDGYFDPIATTATSINQGVVRFLVSGARVDRDGKIIKSTKDGDRTPLMANLVCKEMEFDPFDRQCMTLSNLLHASAVTGPARVSQTLFEGWNQEDGIIISKAFAEGHQIRDLSGEMRPLVVGDKLSDFHGNKGVVGLVVDPEMDEEEAARLKLTNQVAFFKNNPDLDMVMAPFPAVSRYNGGSCRELMQNTGDLKLNDGSVVPGGTGTMRVIITDKSADAKTRSYDEGDLALGSGRKFSSQLAWALNSIGANKVVQSVYKGNNNFVPSLREYLILTGLDMTETGDLRVGYEPHEGEVRQVFEMPELVYKANGNLDMKAMNQAYVDTIGQAGGLMELPFELTYPNGEPLAPMNDGKTDVIYKTEEWTRKGYTRKDGVYVRPTTVRRQVASSKREGDGPISWGLPVLSSYLRSGQTFVDGSSMIHDYTHKYSGIFKDAILYRQAEEKLADKNLSVSDRAKYEKNLKEAPIRAQSQFDDITRDIKERIFSGKHNIFRDKAMSRRIKDSATSIISADPRLSLDTIGIGPALADALDLDFENGKSQELLFWRDPILRDGNVRYMKVALDERLTGVSIHPAGFKSFEGDFDGDTVGLVKLSDLEAIQEARDLLSVSSNLLDLGVKGEDGLYDLAFSSDLDFKVALHDNPKLAEKYEEIRKEVNAFENPEAKLDKAERQVKRYEALGALDDLYAEAYEGQCGRGVIRYGSMEDHLTSVKEICLDTGAKGSPSKFRDYMKWLGVEGKEKGDSLTFESLTDHKKSLASRKDHEGTMYATAVKSFGTGVAGSYSQRGVARLRNTCPKAVLELTYPVTQSLLQAKHDPQEAYTKYEMLMGPVRQLWRGYKLEEGQDGSWSVVKDDQGQPVQDKVESWKANFDKLYTSKKGLNVRYDDKWLNQVTEALSEDGVMLNIEGESDGRAPLDQLAYGGTYETLCELAEERRNLYEGEYHELFTPGLVRQNKIVAEKNKNSKENEKVKLTGLVKSDTIKQEARPKRSYAVPQTTYYSRPRGNQKDDGFSL